MKTRNIRVMKKSFFSIKAKVTLLTTCSIIIAVLVTFFNMVAASKDIITKSNETTLQNLAKTYSNNLSDTIRQLSQSANFLMSSTSIPTFVESGGTEAATEVGELITQWLSSNTSYEDLSIVDENGIVLYSSNKDLIGKDLSSETYFSEMVSTGLSAQGNAFISDASMEACVTFAIPLRNDFHMMNIEATATTNITDKGNPDMPVEDFTGAIITSVKVSAFDSLLSDITVADYESGFAYILDSSGNVIYHPDEEMIGTKFDIEEINTLVADIENGTTPTSQILTYSYKDTTRYAGYEINAENQWIILVGANQAEVLESLDAVASSTIVTTIILVILLSAVAYAFTRTITKSIKKITLLINKTAALDFTEDNSYSNLSLRKDETGEISRAIDQMRETLKTMITHISEVSTKIAASSDRLNTVSLSVNEHASDNSATAEELSASMQETAATTQQINSAIEQISRNSKDITEKVILGTKLSEDINNRATELMATTTTATQKTQKIYEEVKVKTTAAIEKAKAVEKINILTKTIKDIANQTNLLALNASIEAARAGEAGSGFSVVASEIGNLANQSARTVSHITDTVEEVYQAVSNLSHNLEQTLQFLGNNVLSDYNTFLNSSTKYHSDADLMSNTMENIQNQIDQLSSNVIDITASISEINMMVNEASIGVNDVAEKNTDIVALTSQTQNMSNENTEYASDLKEIVEKFHI